MRFLLRATLVAMATATLLLSAKAATAANLLANGGFEDATLTPWTPFANAASLQRSTDEPHSGSASVLATSRTQFYGGPSQDIAGVLTKGKRYIVSAWVRTVADVDTHLSLMIKQVVGGTTTYTTVDTIPVDQRRWVKLSGSFLYSPSAAPSELSLYIVGPAAGIDFHVDDVAIESWPEWTPTPSVAADFVRRSGAGLVVGAADEPIRLLGVNLTAYGEESETADTVFRSHEFDPEVDFARIAALGANVVRLNLWWKLFENESAPFTYKAEGWDWLDRIVVAARAEGVRLILDMHAPQGGFQGPGSSSAYWSSTSLQSRHDALMAALATRYRDEPWIAAFDILNEPSPPNDAAWRARAAALVAAIRAVDANHLVIVEQSFADDYGPFLLSDPKLVYEYHWYERWRYTSQLSYPNGAGDYGVSYPDADVTIPPYDDVPGDLVKSATLAEGTTAWTELVGDPFVVSDPAVYGGVPAAWATSMSGKLWLDEIVVEELDDTNQVVRVLSSVDIEKKPTEWWFLHEYEPWHSFASDWAGTAVSGSGSWGIESTGHRGDASISLRSATGTYTVASRNLLVALKQGHRYRVRAWVRGDAVTGAAGIGVRLQEFAAWESFVPFTKDSLESSLMAEGGSFYQAAGVPVNIGEFGQSPRNFAAKRGGGAWAADMLDLFATHGMSAQWFDWHSGNFGAYTNTLGFPEPIGANQPLLDLLADRFGGPGVQNLIAIAGRDRTLRVGEHVLLDGSQTVGTVTGWSWAQEAGPPVALSGSTTNTVAFDGPASPGVVKLSLVVTGPGGTSQDSVELTFLEPCPTTMQDTGCLDASNASLAVDERRGGMEKLKASWSGFPSATSTASFGDPVAGTSRFSLCLYGDGTLAGEMLVDKAAATCGSSPCWKASGAGWAYKDKGASSDGVRTISAKPGAAGSGGIKVSAGNKASAAMTSMPTGMAAALAAASNVTMQFRVDDGACVSTSLGWISAHDATRFTGGR